MKYIVKILIAIAVIAAVLPFESGTGIKNPGATWAEPANMSNDMLLAQATAPSDATAAEYRSGRLSVTDREIIERLTRIEERVEQGQKALSQRIEDVNNSLGKRIDDLNSKFYILFAMIIALFGYIVWDRRTALHPLIEKTRVSEKLLDALKEYAREEPKLAEVLRSFGLF